MHHTTDIYIHEQRTTSLVNLEAGKRDVNCYEREVETSQADRNSTSRRENKRLHLTLFSNVPSGLQSCFVYPGFLKEMWIRFMRTVVLIVKLFVIN
jgi:hypothetical protein